MMQFRTLGPLEVSLPNGGVMVPSSPKICKVLALLLLQDGISSVPLLLRELWGDTPPRSALTTLQTYVYHIRRMLARVEVSGDAGPALVTRAPGYELHVPDDAIDAKLFERHVRQAGRLLVSGEPERASALLRKALSTWQGPPLANISGGDVLRGHIVHLEEMRIQALELQIESERRVGRRRELIPNLRLLVSTYPFHEWFHLQLINELHHSGRRAEALQAYQDLRRILNEELGVEPTAEVRRLQQQVLASH